MIRHIPVLTDEIIEQLHLVNGTKVIDCTLGDAGHAEAMLQHIGKRGRLLGIDADVEAILRAKRFLYRYEDRFIAVRDNFVNLKKIVESSELKSADAILMDLGWSSPQFAERGRGFSFRNLDEELDMRYSTDEELQAKNILNEYTTEELGEIFRKYGEESQYKKIATAIEEAREIKEIKTVNDLVEIVQTVKKRGKSKIHPATKVFQALRIATNDELEILKKALPQAIEVLSGGGRLAVISFHSLEDRIVKQFFKKNEASGGVKIITKKPITASFAEIKNNPRSRSAKMRVIEKITTP